MESKDLKQGISKSLQKIKDNVLNNIEYDFKTNKVKYKSFDSLDLQDLMKSFIDEWGEETINKLNVEAFFRKINQILYLKKRNTKRKIKEEFVKYIESFDRRLKDGEDYKEDDFFDKIDGEYSIIPRKRYEGEKFKIQVELLKLQEWSIKNGKRIAIVFEGRDAAGKGSTIKRFVEYLNPKHYRVVALGVPTPEEKKNWFGRYEKHLPKPGEIVFFDRSWYNRSVVEPAMGYCSEEEYMDFMENVSDWEEDLISDGMILVKFWFSITREKQELRFKLRQQSPLKYWKFSPNDAKVIDKWDVITHYKNQMFSQTSTKRSPWVIVNSNDKKIGRLNAMRYFLSVIDYDGKDEEMTKYYPEVINVLI